MQPDSLTIVLPAFNEEARLGSALDELFGYLVRHGARGQDGAPGAAALPADIRVLAVDDGSTDGTAAVVRARPEAVTAEGAPHPPLAFLQVPPAGTGGRSGPARWPRTRTSCSSRTRTWRLPRTRSRCWSPRSRTTTSRWAAGSSPTARTCGPASRPIAACWAALSTSSHRSGRSAPCRTRNAASQDTQCGFKGFAREAEQDLFARRVITSIVFDVELIYLARRRVYWIAVAPIRWADKRGSRMRTRPVLALRVAWDLLRARLIHRRVLRFAAHPSFPDDDQHG